MPGLFCGALWAGLVGYLLFRAWRQFGAFRRATLATASEFGPVPALSIIVPVRNEIDNIAICLAGLRAQTCLAGNTQIIIVDDESEDGTTAVLEQAAALDPRIKLAAAGALTDGWVGKPHACWRGALLAKGDWLCFIDADVRAAPELVASALTAAAAQGIDMLSLQPLQELGSFWERLVIPAGLLMLACAKPFRSAEGDAANGQFLLIRRSAYFAIGGHSAVRSEICEDKALAGLAKAAGFNFRVLAAEHLARTRMYRDLASLWEGLSKNATELLGSHRQTLIAGLTALVFGWTTLLLPAVLAAAAFSAPSPAAVSGAVLAVLGSVAVIAIQIGTARHFRIPAVFGVLFALGYTAAACLACHSVVAHLKGRVTWKGRSYRLPKSSPERT